MGHRPVASKWCYYPMVNIICKVNQTPTQIVAPIHIMPRSLPKISGASRGEPKARAIPPQLLDIFWGRG